MRKTRLLVEEGDPGGVLVPVVVVIVVGHRRRRRCRGRGCSGGTGGN